MTIEFTECQAIGGTSALFADLATHDAVDKLLGAHLDGTSRFHVLDLGITWDGKTRRLKSAGEKTPDADAIMKSLRRLPRRRREIPSDSMTIHADAFEQEMFITLP